ncbi:sialate O-acetylesterase [Pelagicoccus sp. SDUM812005]|uniref:sialate O-acetylesterase n=1 Tax=Pelagicoccus sp. SDUM812005 TaxID=3041257 RepID=UPI00280FC52B|nr:sialate O-acetylesterase [Pelagicoccus sp. SDUM812005]MDQ8181013.1 sialate O-acetylesterase [Pelagicoccus sp. SDUM812005]
MRFSLLALALSLHCSDVLAELRLPALVSDGMVLQQESDARIWGWANAGETVEVSVSWGESTAPLSATANNNGRWSVALGTPAAGGPHTVTVSTAAESISVSNILIGEVWLCSGQSNMAMPVEGFKSQPVEGSQEAIINGRDDSLRFFPMKVQLAEEPAEDVTGAWQSATPESVSRFSAVGYFFGEKLRGTLDVPIGLILAARSSSAIESWLPRAALKTFSSEDLIEQDPDIPHRAHSSLYNGMIAPIGQYTLRGALWYQGEGNRHHPLPYAKLLPSLIENWRQTFESPELPFYFAQIAPNVERFNELTEQQDRAAYLRETQFQTAKNLPHTGMVVTLDLGSPHTIHPPQKRKVADRFAYFALRELYGYTSIGASGPVFESVSFEGSTAILHFTGMAKGFLNYEVPLDYFTIAGDDRIFHPATAIAKRDGTVHVSSDHVQAPKSVRYAWKNWTGASLFDSAGLPASSFRTDEWSW